MIASLWIPSFVSCLLFQGLAAAANFTALGREKTKPAPAALPLKLKFTGSSVLLFGESTPRSCKYHVTIDGKDKDFNACQLGQSGIGRMLQVVAEGLDPVKEHTLEITPLFDSPDKPQELRLESICIAGPETVAVVK